jgi:hypothetical protein
MQKEEQMKRLLTAAAAAFTLAACADGGTPVEPRAAPDRPAATKYYYSSENIFTTQTPASTLDATGGWQVGTRFTTTREGLLSDFRFYKAVGETGSHTAKLYTASGTLLWSLGFSFETSSGWQQTSSIVSLVLPAGTYIVSVNTNTKQVKTFGYFTDNGTIQRTYLSADAGAYGQPTGSLPSTISGSAFFVDVVFSPMRCDTDVDSPCP